MIVIECKIGIKIYQIIKELRSKYRNSGWKYYVISGSTISDDGQEVNNDGWMLTRDRIKISNYLNTNVEKAITMKENFENMKKKKVAKILREDKPWRFIPRLNYKVQHLQS